MSPDYTCDHYRNGLPFVARGDGCLVCPICPPGSGAVLVTMRGAR